MLTSWQQCLEKVIKMLFKSWQKCLENDIKKLLNSWQQCLGKVINNKVISLIPLKGPNPLRHEKNWLPYMIDDNIYVIYLTNK